ncbi:hypothetical protein V500_02731 [Pseudogymnoascus sp. VKM F-4518 (FW-2643)]|nr:hypothetical protein V500_02731 [Pseudogymnoascus sp. VKM F-4518 (FW-2643)]
MSTRKRIRETKPKTKTFTGCWTCRRRKVKCDGSRPTCSRCSKTGVHCDGYNVELYWITDADASTLPSAIKRQARCLEPHTLWSFPDCVIDEQLSDLDKAGCDGTDGEPSSSGPFGVFSVMGPSMRGQQRTEQPLVQNPKSNNNTPDKSNSRIFSQHSSYGMSSTSTGHSHVDSMTSSISFELNKGYRQNILEGQLMENYVRNVATLLQPIPHSQNTYSSLYVPNALLGSATLRGGPTRGGSGTVAIFFSLLATSAFNLRTTDMASTFEEVARTLRLKAFDWLQMALEELPELGHGKGDLCGSSVSQRYESAISAILTLITADIMEGSMSEYQVHLAGVNRICKQTQDQSIELDRRLVTISSFLTVLSDTTSIDLLPIPWSTRNAFPDSESNMFTDGCSLEVTYGITATLANYLHQVTVLSQNISHFISQNLPIHPTLLSTCDEFSKTISSWSIDWENLSSLPAANCNVSLAKIHILAFAQSLQIYFHTRVLPCTDSEMAQYVQRVAEYLMEIEAVRAQQGRNIDVTASIMWPGFIASCEAEPDARDIWYEWWEGMRKYQIGNISKLWMVVKQAWAMRDEGLKEVPAWMPVLRCTGTKILAV